MVDGAVEPPAAAEAHPDPRPFPPAADPPLGRLLKEVPVHCPVCKTTALVMSERVGVEIDYCPSCRGVWLDRGELDKILERASAVPPAPAAAYPSSPPGGGYPAPRRYDDDDDDYKRYGHKRKKSSWLSEIFD